MEYSSLAVAGMATAYATHIQHAKTSGAYAKLISIGPDLMRVLDW